MQRYNNSVSKSQARERDIQVDYLKRLLKKHGDLLRYFLSGSCTSMIGICGYSLLVWWGMSPVTANVTAWSIEVSVA